MRLLPFCVVVVACAQTQAPVGIVRGRLVQISAVSIEVKTNAGDAVQCGLDPHTYMEREGQRIFHAALRPGDPLEVMTDRKGGTCYARTVRGVTFGAKQTAVRPYRSLDYLYPRGNLTFTGVVRRLNAQVLVLRTREEPEKMVLLRDDTRFLDSGTPSEFSGLAVNTRVFVRGGRNLENELEAYQVIWGEIPGPGPHVH